MHKSGISTVNGKPMIQNNNVNRTFKNDSNL